MELLWVINKCSSRGHFMGVFKGGGLDFKGRTLRWMTLSESISLLGPQFPYLQNEGGKPNKSGVLKLHLGRPRR